VQVPLDLGRQIVYGAIGYTRELGFEPHADFGQAAGYLGAWDGKCALTFGRDGKADVHLRALRRRGEDHPQATLRPR
jgi:hypothetical protein